MTSGGARPGSSAASRTRPPGTAYLGIDLGATTLSVVVGDETGEVIGRFHGQTPSGPDGTALAEAVLGGVRAACDDAGCDPTAIVAAGIGAIGPLDPAAGAVIDPVNLPGIDRIELVEPVAQLVDADVRLHNDATAAAIGERFYAADNPPDLVYLTISTGIGAGVISDGRVIAGHRGNAAEMGHVTLDPTSDLRCGCGARGHWEALCGGSNLAAHARSLAPEFETDLQLDQATPATLLAAAGSDPLATHLAERIGTWNAIGVSILVHAYDPARVVAGGAVARNHPGTILDPIRDELPEHTLESPPPIDVTELGSGATVRGALASALTGGDGAVDGNADRNR